jgi:hypothetical protein
MRFLIAVLTLSLLFSAVGPQILAPQTLLACEHEQPLGWQAADSALPNSALTGRGAQLQRLWLGEFKARSELGCLPVLQESPPAEFRLADAAGLSHASRCAVLLQHVRLQL